MKTLRSIVVLCIFLFLFGTAKTGAVTPTLLTFDDLSPGSGSITIPNGYGGLQWLGFGVIAGTEYPNSAYYTGMVSPTNVAFNDDEFDRTADISSSAGFTLNSAYWTAGNRAPMQIEAQGFQGANMVYDNIYVISPTAPTQLNFNYSDITSVEFLPEAVGSTNHYVSDASIFVMDNLSVSVVPEPSSWALFSVGAVLAVASSGFSRWKRRNL